MQSISKMQRSNVKAVESLKELPASPSSSITPFSTDKNRVILNTGIIFDVRSSCNHTRPFSNSSDCCCSFCCYCYRVFNFFKKCNFTLNRINIQKLLGCDFVRAYELSSKLYRSALSSTYTVQYAASTTGHRVSYQYACPISGNLGDSTESFGAYPNRGVCNNVEHLFECCSASDQARGEFFPIPREDNYWHATCKDCGASCAFASPREGMIMITFLRLLKVRFDGQKYFVSLLCENEWQHCSKSFATVVLMCNDAHLCVKNLENNHIDPPKYPIRCNVYMGNLADIKVNLGVAKICRFHRDEDVLLKEDCAHIFFLTNLLELQLELSDTMLRVLMYLMPGHGYLQGVTEIGEQAVPFDKCWGIISAGGYNGVNLRCNSAFAYLHENFYGGSFRESVPSPFENLIEPVNVVLTHDIEALVPHMELDCTKQSGSGQSSYYEEEEAMTVEEAENLIDKLNSFKFSDSTLFDVSEDVTPRTTTRGLGSLKKRIGGLLKGVSNCVTKLHAVWDWPLDTTLKAVEGVGSWLDENKASVSDTVWSCQQCPELQKDLKKSVADQELINELFQSALQKISQTLDDITRLNVKNIEKIEELVKELNARIDELQKGPKLSAADNDDGWKSKREKELEELRNTLEKLKEKNKALKEKEKRKDSGEERPKIPAGRPVFYPAGEQMPVPRSEYQPVRRYKHSSVSDVEAQGLKKVLKSCKKRISNPFRKKRTSLPCISLDTESCASSECSVLIPECVRQADTTFEGGEHQEEQITGHVIQSVGASEEHNAISSKLYLGNVKWEVSSGSGKVLKNFHIPQAIWKSNDRLRNFMSYFQYYDCEGMIFTVTSTSIPLQGGTLLLCWDAGSCATKQAIDSALQLSNLPHVRLHASSSRDINFEVPSSSIQHQLCTSGSEGSVTTLGCLKVVVANVLNAPAETSQSVQLNFWVKFKNPKISFMTVRHDLVAAQQGNTLGNLNDIENMSAIVSQGVWSTTSSTNLMELTVHPTAVHVENGLVTQTSLSVISHLFGRWCGSMKYTFVFGASMFVKGKVVVSAIPVAFRDRTMTLTEVCSFPSIVCDLSEETREFEFEVPYISIGKNSLVCKNSLYDVSSFNAEFVVSRIHMLILDPLLMTSNASNKIEFYVSAGPGKDFELSDLSGIKAEYVNRVVQQSFASALKVGKLLGSGFSEWVQIPSVLGKFTLDKASNNALHFMVSPYYRTKPPCVTSLSWLSQLFVQWSGSLVYTLRAHSYDKQKACFIKVWHDVNGSTQSGQEFEFISEVDPPSGAKVEIWQPFFGQELRFVVPFTARTDKLVLNKARYVPDAHSWIQCYNGAVVIDYEGEGKMDFEISISGGPNFEMYEQTVAPRCGNVSNAFTYLSYNKKLHPATDFPREEGVLSGPTNKAIIKPVKFSAVPGVSAAAAARRFVPEPQLNESDTDDEYNEGDSAEDEEGRKIVFHLGKWRLVDDDDVERQVGCFPCASVDNIKESCKILEERKTLQKVAELVDAGHSTLIGENSDTSKIAEMAKQLGPILDSVKNITGSLEAKLDYFEGVRGKILGIVKSLFSESIPGMIKSGLENENYMWATLLTFLGGIGIVWATVSAKKIKKRLALLCMVVWAPFLMHNVWKLGKWIKKKASDLWNWNFERMENKNEMCRKHSLAGAVESSKQYAGDFTNWLSQNWASASKGILSLLGVAASLIIWGSIPDEKKLSSFSAKFKAAGDRGRSFTNILSGFSVINKTCSEWSKKFVSWIMSMSHTTLPKQDSAMQAMLDFDLKAWVLETREMALAENRFKGFGAETHLEKVRKLYDKSQVIQEKLLDGCKVDFTLGAILKECKDKCNELLNESYTFKGMKQSRIDPLHVCLFGSPGVGKSALTHVLINNLLDYREEPEVDRIFTRCCADAYWSNYHQEPVILYDDLGAIKSNLRLSDFAEIMGVKTNDPYSVPMAAVEDKGRHCTSKYVFSCTNILELDDTGDVVTKAAYYRRRNVLVVVEKDLEVERSEANPTQGLLFTVMGHVPAGDGRVQFGVKEEWPESFLSDVDTSDWRFEKVEYRTFLRFLCKYTDAYMASQEKLLKGIKSYRINPMLSEEDDVEAHADGKTVTLSEFSLYFDKMNFEGKKFHNFYKGTKYLAPTRWKAFDKATFKELYKTLCGCIDDEGCAFSLRLKQLGDIIQDKGLFSCSKHFVLKKGNSKDPMLAEVKIISSLKEIHEKVHPAVIFYMLATYYKWSVNDDICFYHLNNTDSGAKLTVKVNYAQRVTKEVVVTEDNNKCVEWSSLGLFFPIGLKKNGCVTFYDGKEWIIVKEHLSDKCDIEGAKAYWLKMWREGPEIECKFHKLFKPDHQKLLNCLSYGITDFGDALAYTPELRECIDSAKSVFSQTDLVMFFLYLLYLNEKNKGRVREEKKFERKVRSFHADKKFSAYEEKVTSSLSKNAKIALAIGGGIVGVGILAGLVLGLKSLFSTLSTLGGEDDDDITEDVNEDLCDERQVTGASASDGMATIPVRNQRLKPKIVFKNVEMQVSGSHESDGMKTSHVVTLQKKPLRLIKQGKSMGVVYDETTTVLNTSLRDERRKKVRSKIRATITKCSKECNSDCQQCLKGTEQKWVGYLEKNGIDVKASTDGELPIPAKVISCKAESGILGELMVDKTMFDEDASVRETLEKFVSPGKATLTKLVKEGTTMKVAKQATIGSYGLEKDTNMIELLHSHVSHMSALIIIEVEGAYLGMSVLRMMSTFVLMPAHYFTDLEGAEKIYFVCPHKIVQIRMDTNQMALVSAYQDLLVWNLGNEVPPSPDYTKHIPTKADWKNFRKSSGVLALTKYNADMMIMINHTLATIEMCTIDVDVPTGTYEMINSEHTVVSGLRYRVHCMPGFCGAAIVKADTKSVRKIIGMHVAGSKSKGIGYAETLVFEDIIKAMNRVKDKCATTMVKGIEKVDLPDHVTKHSVEVVGKGNLGIVGVVSGKYVPNVPTRTTIAKSMIHGLIGEVLTEPSILSTWDHRLGEKRGIFNPMLDADLKYGTPIVPFPSEEIKEIEDHLAAFFVNKNNSLNKREVNSLEIGINGIDQSDFWAPMEMKTSAGYPYTVIKPTGAIGKSWLFEEDGVYPSGRVRYVMKDKDFIENFERMHADIRSGVKPHIISMACPKDERRKLNKIYDKPATRTFTILPPEINILFRMYFGDFAAMVMSTRFDHFCQVGINPESLEWSELMNSFLRVGSRGFAGDYAKFDGVGPAAIYMSIAEIANSWYNDGPVNFVARRALVSAIVHRVGLVENLLLTYSQGMPSGFSMTVIFNGFVNYYFMALAWMNIISETPLSPQSDLESFDTYTKLVVYGDDNVVCVDDAFLPYYNLRTVASYLADFGVTYTDDAKNPIHLSDPDVDITTVSFLKRTFERVGGTSSLWKAPLAKISIEERCNWIRECEIPVEALNQNIESALYEAHIHGDVYFNDLKNRVDAALDRVLLPASDVTFKECSKRWWSNMSGAVLSQPVLAKLANMSANKALDLGKVFKDLSIGKDLPLKKILENAKTTRLSQFNV